MYPSMPRNAPIDVRFWHGLPPMRRKVAPGCRPMSICLRVRAWPVIRSQAFETYLCGLPLGLVAHSSLLAFQRFADAVKNLTFGSDSASIVMSACRPMVCSIFSKELPVPPNMQAMASVPVGAVGSHLCFLHDVGVHPAGETPDSTLVGPLLFSTLRKRGWTCAG